MKTIINVPNPILRNKSKPVKKLDDKTKTVIKELADTLLNKTNPPGVGLSAIQIGIPLRIFVTYLPDIADLQTKDWKKQPQKLIIYINPEYLKCSEKQSLGGTKDQPDLEGCLSIPRIWGPIYRHEQITFSYQTTTLKDLDSLTSPKDLKTVKGLYKHFTARVIQHEYDHLEGVLFTDYSLQEKLPVYMEAGEEMNQLDNPEAIITW